MNKKTKFLLVSLCAVFLVAASVLGTLAWFTDDEKTVNTFTVGKVDIHMDEAKVNEYGVPVTSAERVEEGNTYKIIPGHTYVKDPTVRVDAGSEKCYVRMLVTLNKMDAIKTIFGENFLPQNYVGGWDSAKWPCVSVKDNGDNTATYEFRYHTAVGEDFAALGKNLELEPLFETITFPGSLNEDQVKTLEGFTIDVVAHAIQSDGFADANAAWDAFPQQ